MPASTIDRAVFGELVSNVGADFIAELVDTYCQETPQLLAELQQALARADAEAFRRAAHSIKSSSASLGALDFSALARALEMTGKSGDLSSAAPAVGQLAGDYDGVAAALREMQHGG